MPIAPEGHLLVGAAAALALAGLVAAALAGSWPLWLAGYISAAAALALAFFFRDPERVGVRGAHLILAPADGRIVEIAEVEEPVYLKGRATRVSTFLSLLDVHVQRAPVAGVVEYRAHRPGRFHAAWQARASRENEQASIGIDAGDYRVLVRQIAGVVARRIVTYVERGERVEQGERIGMIRFGSRVETYLPAGSRLRVRAGDRVYAGRTILAELPADDR